MEWPIDCYPNAEISSEVSTALIHGNPRSPYEVNHDGYCFTHFIKIKKNKGLLWIMCDTTELLSGRQYVIDYLNDFCDKYCVEQAV